MGRLGSRCPEVTLEQRPEGRKGGREFSIFGPESPGLKAQGQELPGLLEDDLVREATGI